MNSSLPTMRVDPPRDAEMDDEQRTLAVKLVAGRNGMVRGPYAIWLHVPEIARRIDHLSDRLRKGSLLERRLVELIVLVMCRGWKADHAWKTHAAHAIAAGIPEEAVAALGRGETPAFARDDEQLVYAFFDELSRTHAVTDATYARAVATFGRDAVIEMVATAGLYTMLAMTLAVFDVPAS